MQSDLPSKIVVITGASRGIGLAIAKRLRGDGYFVYACSRSMSADLKELINNDNVSEFFQLDLHNDDSIRSCVRSILSRKPDIHAIVNCAGVASGALFSMTKMEDVKRVFQINIFGPLLFTQGLAKRLIRRKNGVVVNIGSTAGCYADKGTLAYGGSKAALVHATRVLAVELGAFNIRVNAIAPGVVDTEMAELMDEAAREELVNRSALSGVIAPDHVADAVAFLVSEQGSKISGQVIRIDGGTAF